MALAQADPPQRSLGVTADRRHHQFIQSFQDPGLNLDRGLLSAPPAANPLAAPRRSGPEVRQAAAYGAAGNSAAAGSACFTGREQASVSFIEERSECIAAGSDGILVDHPARLHAKTPDWHRLFRVRSLRYCRILESFLPSRLFWLRPLERNCHHDTLADNQDGEEIQNDLGDEFHPRLLWCGVRAARRTPARGSTTAPAPPCRAGEKRQGR
jgi:hypothetical protein